MSGSTDRSLKHHTFVLVRPAAAVERVGPRPTATTASFGYTDDGSTTSSTPARTWSSRSASNGDLTSLVYRGTEYQGYGGKNSHVESGLGTSTVTIAQSGSTILVSVAYGTLKHYYAARSGENNVYLWTNKADTWVSASRYIVRVKAGLFLNDEPDSYTYAPTTIESADVFAKSDGQTRSKHYSKLRVIDYDYIGWTTGSVGLWIMRHSDREGLRRPVLPLPAAPARARTAAGCTRSCLRREPGQK